MTAIFVGIDISDQAYIFATVNLEQTKVRKSFLRLIFSSWLGPEAHIRLVITSLLVSTR